MTNGASGAGAYPISVPPLALSGYEVRCEDVQPPRWSVLTTAHAEGRLEERLGFFAKPKLLIID
jgi:hypothetical protein